MINGHNEYNGELCYGCVIIAVYIIICIYQQQQKLWTMINWHDESMFVCIYLIYT